MTWTFEWLDSASRPHLGGDGVTPHAAAVKLIVTVVLLLAACGGATPAASRARTLGAIAGLARDLDSGDPVAKADVRVRGQGDMQAKVTTTSDRGLYDVDQLPPGTYQLTARFAGQPVDVMNIEVRAGETSYVDLVFTLGRPEPLRVDYGDKAGEIGRYRPPALGAGVSIIEGTVNDTSTRGRVPGAVVTAVKGDQTEQTISDDHGRFRFDAVAPGTYAVSAYYSISGRGQIEVRRSEIEVAGAEAVIVPLWIELTR